MKKLFNAIFSLRYVAILAVIAPFLGAVLMLLLGTKDTFEAYLLFFGLEEPEGTIASGEAAMIHLVASIDHFLFAAILIIFAIGLYSLFFRIPSHQTGKDGQSTAPSWRRLKNLGGMDEMLLKVIMMLLAVSFLEYILTAGINTLNWEVLVVPITIVALAIGLKWMSATSLEEEKEEKGPPKSAVYNDYIDALERLAKLHEQGMISDVEFAEAKGKLQD